MQFLTNKHPLLRLTFIFFISIATYTQCKKTFRDCLILKKKTQFSKKHCNSYFFEGPFLADFWTFQARSWTVFNTVLHIHKNRTKHSSRYHNKKPAIKVNKIPPKIKTQENKKPSGTFDSSARRRSSVLQNIGRC